MKLIIVEVKHTLVVVSWCCNCQTYTSQSIMENGNGMCWCGEENDKSQALFQAIQGEIL